MEAICGIAHPPSLLRTTARRCILCFVFCILYFVICISNAQQAPFLLRTTARLLQIQKQIQGQRIQLQFSDL